MRPWTSLLDADTASAAVAHLAKASSKLGGLSSEDQNTISGIFKATEEPSIPLAHLSTFLTLKVYRPFTDTLGQPNIFERSFTVDIDEPTVTRLLNETDPEATALVTKLAETCPSVVRLLASVLDAQADLLGQAALLPVVAQLLDLPDPVQFTQSKDRLLLTAYKALGSKSVDVSNAARSVLIRAADPEGLSRLLGEVDLKTFSEAHAQLALDLAKIGKPEHLAGITHVLSIALQQIARSCSDEGDLEMATLETLILTCELSSPPVASWSPGLGLIGSINHLCRAPSLGHLGRACRASHHQCHQRPPGCRSRGGPGDPAGRACITQGLVRATASPGNAFLQQARRAVRDDVDL